MCGLRIEGYTYNSKTAKCEPFHQVGCKISGNGWGTKRTCELACVKKTGKKNLKNL